MARQVYSQQLVQQHNLTGDIAYVVPAGYRLVIRDIAWWVDNGGLTGAFFFAFGSSGGTFVWFTVDVDTTVMHHEEGRYVFEPGETVTFHADIASDLLVSGYLLSLP